MISYDTLWSFVRPYKTLCCRSCGILWHIMMPCNKSLIYCETLLDLAIPFSALWCFWQHPKGKVKVAVMSLRWFNFQGLVDVMGSSLKWTALLLVVGSAASATLLNLVKFNSFKLAFAKYNYIVSRLQFSLYFRHLIQREVLIDFEHI